jgi:hypothetical protein
MKVISKPECADWLKANIASDFTVEKVEEEYPFGVAYLQPSDTGKKTALGRTLVGLLHVKSPGLFWITATGIWPTSENMALFDGYRESFGENRPLHAAPGHVFSGSDLKQVECLLDLALYFYWDSVLFEVPTGIAVKTSHDEYISVRAKDRDRLSQIERALIDFELEQLNPSSTGASRS